MKRNLALLLTIFVAVFYFPPAHTAYGATDIVNDGTLSTGLVSCWSLDEASGTRLDATASNNDLTDNNTVLSGTGIQDLAADFENDNAERLSITDNASLSLTSDISIASWVKFESVTTGQMGLVSKWTTSGRARSYLLFTQDNRLQFTVSNTGSYITQKFVSWTPTTSTWYHLAAVYDASAGSVTFYVDGSQLGSTQTGLPTSVHNNTSALTLGNSDGTSYFDGLQDEVALWAKTITSTEVSDLYAGGSGIPCVSSGGGSSRRVIFAE